MVLECYNNSDKYNANLIWLWGGGQNVRWEKIEK